MVSVCISTTAIRTFIVIFIIKTDSAVRGNTKEKECLDRQTYNYCNDSPEYVSAVEFHNSNKDPNQQREKHTRKRES